MTLKKAILLASLIAGAAVQGGAVASDTTSAPAHWDYAGASGPSHWGELQDFASCKAGKAQSPIDIRAAKAAKLAPLDFHYAASPAEIVNNGHTVQVNLEHAGSVKLLGSDYKLLQFHFHTPSEEKINGKRYPLVAHLVHKNDAGELAVVAVLFKQGKENPALKQAFTELPAVAGEHYPLSMPVDIAAALPAHHAYYAYTGSLTTPPCSEGVHWQVMREPVEISRQQLAAFRKLYTMNARPVQPLNGRAVQVGG